ncbi:hypothetical protein MNBD_BACTEROID06-1695 [hydrothermal vent metagenome]|uniref:Histidine phosphatase family protein n=1 Tax=hydrothermal vent metagenome TaxID=652676 RepID=A0A3B0UB72_9ZZZZ
MKYLLTLLLSLSLATCYAQETTFILVRHAEKANDGTKDPALTAEGEARAENLQKMFEEADVAAVYSTNYKRTQLTVAPLAQAKGLEVKPYGWKNPKELLSKILEANAGGIVIISGHSNTTPVLANLLTGKATFTTFEDSDYGNLLIITTTKIGEGNLLQLRY